jgi:hypothetical protein
MPEVHVGREQHELMTDAELSDQGINRPRLDSALAATISNLCRSDVIVAVGNQEGEGREVLDDLFFGLRTGEPLQEFLKDQTG